MTRSAPDPDRPDTPSAQANTPPPGPNPDTCHTIRTESGPALIRAADPLTDLDRHHLGEVLAATQRRYEQEHPDQEQRLNEHPVHGPTARNERPGNSTELHV